MDVECDAKQQLKTISIHLYCRQRSKTLTRLPPEYLIGGFLRYVDQHYPLHSTASEFDTVLVTTTLATFYRILETVQTCGSKQDQRLFHAHFSRWADLSCLLRRKMFGLNAVKAGTDAPHLLAELAAHMRLPPSSAADPLCVIQNAFEQFFPLHQHPVSSSPSHAGPLRPLQQDEELEKHLEPVGLSAHLSYCIVLLHISLIRTVVEYAGKSFPTLGAISCMDAATRRSSLILLDPGRREGKTELNSAARAGFAVQRSYSARGNLREVLVWEDGSRPLLTEVAALQQQQGARKLTLAEQLRLECLHSQVLPVLDEWVAQIGRLREEREDLGRHVSGEPPSLEDLHMKHDMFKKAKRSFDVL